MRGLVENVGLQPAQRRTGIHTELIDQHRPSTTQYGESIALATGPIQRQRQQPPAVLTPWMLGHMRVQLRNRLGSKTQCQPSLRRPLDSTQPQLGEP